MDTINNYFYQSESYQQWERNITDEQMTTLTHYEGNGFKDVNLYLRENEMHENVDNIREEISAIDTAIDLFVLEDDIVVHRGVDINVLDMLTMEHNVEYSLEELVGKVYSEKGYTSTTVLDGNRVSESKPVIFTIDVPSGVGVGAYVNKFSPVMQDVEYEFLIKRSADFLIKEVKTEIDDIYGTLRTYIRMELLQ